MNVVVIGGVAAGMSAAAKIKRLKSDARVTVYEKGSFFSYGACGLPYYVAGMEEEYSRLIVRTPEAFVRDGIEPLRHHEVLSVEPEAKIVHVKNLETGKEFVKGYDRLMVASGAQPVRPEIPGIDKEGIYFFKTMEDGIALKDAVAGKKKNVL